jgi:nicotinate-nucleotide adenylyltransferase
VDGSRDGRRVMDEDDLISRLRDRPGLRLGIMGGAFDPIHIAHLVTAEEALLQFGLDAILFMPAGNPPHKTHRLAPAEFRYLLVAVATASHPRFFVSRFETEREQVGYTVDTLEHLAGVLSPGSEVFFVTGADAVLDILTWKDPARVLELCTFIAATRPGYDLARLSGVLDEIGSGLAGPGPEARVKVMEVPALAISSSMIRERLASGSSVRYLVPDSVAQLIEKSGLYTLAAASPATWGACTP